jgi:hypothetical protein
LFKRASIEALGILNGKKLTVEEVGSAPSEHGV